MQNEHPGPRPPRRCRKPSQHCPSRVAPNIGGGRRFHRDRLGDPRLQDLDVETVPIDLPLTAKHSALVNYAVLANRSRACTSLSVVERPRSGSQDLAHRGCGCTPEPRRRAPSAPRPGDDRSRAPCSACHGGPHCPISTVAIHSAAIAVVGRWGVQQPGRWCVAGHRRSLHRTSEFDGFPAISVPITAAGRLPVGIQLMAGPHEGHWLLWVAEKLLGGIAS